MATYFYDWDNGNNANAGTQVAPKKYPTGATWTAGDAHLFKRGTRTYTQGATARVRVTTVNGGGPGNYVRFGAWGDGPNPIFDATDITGANGGVPWQYPMFVDGSAKYAIIEDLDVTGSYSSGLRIGHDGGTEINNIIVRRCRAYGCAMTYSVASDGIQVGAGLDGALLNGIVLEDCDAFDNGGHGMKFRQNSVNCVMRRCRAWNNALYYAGHNMGTSGAQVSISGSWSLVSGNIYQRTLTPGTAMGVSTITNDNFDGLAAQGVGGYWLMDKASNPSAPGSGEFGVPSNNLLYANFGGSNPGSTTMYVFCRSPRRNLVIKCESWACVDGNGSEGHGIALDAVSYDCVVTGCISRNNQGYGISLNNNFRSRAFGNLIVGNRRGIYDNGGRTNYVICNTIEQDNAQACIMHSGRSILTARNNVLIGGSAGIYRSGASDSTVEEYNIYYGQSDGSVMEGAVAQSLGTGSVEADPLLDSSYRPTAASPCVGAGLYIRGVKHFGGVSMNPASPDIGAHRYFAARSQAERHVAGGRA